MTLSVQDVHTYYGRSHVLQGISLDVADGETVALLGRNGAGKTTTMRSIVGLTPARRGRITLDGTDITGLTTHRIARHGIAFVPSGRRAYASLTVRQNLALSIRRSSDSGGWTLDRVLETFPKLQQLSDRRAGHLSGGEQQMLKLGRALLSVPRILLLDEPTEGLSPAIVSDLGRWLGILKEEKITVLITEQNALFALKYADRGYIIEKGLVRHEAPASELRESTEIQRYLGVAASA
ncbi:ABC transporter ATP-binding protein [Flexivirga oryzae]|uniref:Branched-chain amino acid transport system ATP-binding protein n=1 Tax=Flexivirga oryzae TaxID=1794944 RepID=A0A839NA44_9MICO|nr:ABC transporter ATP-binding protein [Flexivirga oryzae]MBB2892854.1 branched-chain amino acid transport system ATP-binding protein [Flexivirga oryzae]